MSNWEKVKLEDICINITDGVHNTVKDTINEQYYLLSCKNIKNGNVCIDKHDRTISKETLDRLRKRTQLSKGDVLLSSVGTIGETAIVKEEYPPYEFQRSVAIFKPDKRYITSKFLFYSLNNKKKVLQSMAEGAVQQCLFINPLKQFQILIPPLDKQRKIAGILSALDDKIELNNKINRNLEAQAQAIFKSWFIDFEPFKNGKFIDSELGKIPEGWKVVLLSNIVNFEKGKKPKTTFETGNDGVIPYLTIEALSGGNVTYCETEKMVLAKENEILLVMDGASSGTLFYGMEGAVASTIAKLNSSDISLQEIIFEFISYRQEDLKSNNTGSAIPHLDKTYLLSSKMAIPSDKTSLLKASVLLKTLRAKIIQSKKESQRLAQLRDTLLPKLMSGEIDVLDVAV